MASQVEVRGGGDFDGAILQNAATEATLLRLVTAMEARSPGSGAAARELASQQRNTRAVDQSTQAVRSSTQETGRFSQAMKEAAGSLSTLVGAGLQSAFSYLNRGLDVFRETSAVGAAFNNNIFDLATTAAESNMSMEELAIQVQKNAMLFSAFGGTVTMGSKAFGKLSETFRQELGEQFFGMGLTVRDLNDYLAAYLEIEMRSGRLRSRSEKEIRANAAAYIMELDKASKLLGVSRREQEAAMRKVATDPALQLMQANLDATQKAMLTSTVAQLEKLGPGVYDALKDAAFFSTTAQGKVLRQALGGRENARRLLTGDANSPQMLVQLAAVLRSQAEAAGPAALESSSEYYRALGEMYMRFAPIEGRTPQDFENMVKEQQERDKLTTRLAEASDAFNRFKNSILVAILKSPLFEKFLKGLEGAAVWMEKNSPKIITGFSNLFGPVTDWFGTSFDEVSQLFKDGKYQEAFSMLFPRIFDGVKNILISTFETISEFLIYLWTGEMPEKLLSKLNNVSTSFGKAFSDGGYFEDVNDQQRFKKDDFKFSGISSMFGDMFSGLNFNFDTSGLFSGIIESFKGLKATLNEKDVGGKSILEWFTEFKDLFLKIPEVLTVAESKISSLMTMFGSFGGSSGGSGGTISNIKDIVDGLNKLTTWFDNLSISQILKAQMLVSTLTPLTSSMGGGGGSIDFSALSTTLDAVTRLVDRIDKVDVNKFKELMATISPLFTMFAGSGISSMLGGGSSDQTSFVEKIDKTIQLLDKLEKFNTGPITELNTQFKQAYATTNDFVGLREEAVGFVNELAGAIENLTKKMDELVEAIPSGTELLGQATGATDLYNWFKGDGSAGNTTPPANNNADQSMLEYFKELIGINKEQARTLEEIRKDR